VRYIMNPHKEIMTDEDAHKLIDYWSDRIGFDNVYRIFMRDYERRQRKG